MAHEREFTLQYPSLCIISYLSCGFIFSTEFLLWTHAVSWFSLCHPHQEMQHVRDGSWDQQTPRDQDTEPPSAILVASSPGDHLGKRLLRFVLTA